MAGTEQLLEENRLIYVNDSMPGIHREREGGAFVFYDRNNTRVTDEKTLSRIRQLTLPPAWEQVWIAEKPNAHLQATGFDMAGRKQYKYHPDWSRSRNESKYDRLLEFGTRLPKIRKRLLRDISRRKFDEQKVLAIAVSLMQKTHIRIGNASYKQLYGSYGLSTLRDRHVQVEGKIIRLSFKGKKGIVHDISLKDARLARLVKQCRDIPGQELFQYYVGSGERKSIGSGQVNRYLKEITECDFTAKDFRTWAGTMEALRAYTDCEYPQQEIARKKITKEVLDRVSSCLGNTRNVCRKYYIFPALIEAYEQDRLFPYLKRMKRNSVLTGDAGLSADEKVLLSFLKLNVRIKRHKT
jgi:DNA topoisomerase-1